MSDQNKGLYDDQYERFFKSKDQAQGYDFQEAQSGSAAPPAVTFLQKLRWWSWDRWKRMKTIRAARDRRLEEILEIKDLPPK